MFEKISESIQSIEKIAMSKTMSREIWKNRKNSFGIKTMSKETYQVTLFSIIIMTT